MLLRLDAVQQRAASGITLAIKEFSDLPLSIGSVQVQHLNKIVIKEIYLTDEEGDTAIGIPKITAHLSPLYMLKGDVQVNTLIVGNPAIRLYRKEKGSPLNIQFLIDRLSGDSTKQASITPDIRINQIQIYEGTARYDVGERKKEETTLFDPEHIYVENFSANLSLKKFKNDSIAMHIRSLSGRENCGFNLDRITADINATKEAIKINKLQITLPNSKISSGGITINSKKGGSCIVKGSIHGKQITPADFATFLPTLADETLPNAEFKATINGNAKKSNAEISLATSDNSFSLQMNATTDNLLNPQESTLTISNGEITTKAIEHIQKILCDSTGKLDILKRFGEITLEGNTTKNSKGLQGGLYINSSCGTIDGKLTADKKENYSATLQMKSLKLGKILQNHDFGTCNAVADIQGQLGTTTDIAFNSTINNLEYKKYEYSPIDIIGTFNENRLETTINIDDPNADGQLSCTYSNGERKEFKITASIDSLKLDSLNIGNGEHGVISATADGVYNEYEGDKSLFDLRIYNITQTIGKKTKNTRLVHIVDNNLLTNRNLIVNSDFLDAKVAGQFNYTSLANTFKEIVKTHTPSLSTEQNKTTSNNAYIFNIDIKNTANISNLLELPFTIHERASITGQCDDNRKLFHAAIKLNNADINGRKYRKIEANLFANDSAATIRGTLSTPKVVGKKVKYSTPASDLQMSINTTAKENQINTVLEWHRDTVPLDKGELKVNIGLTGKGNEIIAEANIAPSEITYNSTEWKLSNCNIKYSKNEISVDNLHLASDERSLTAKGRLGKTAEDIFNVHLNDINLETILDIVNFRAVTFGGNATGNVTLSSALDSPEFESKLNVNKFTFEDGYLGKLSFAGNWNKEKKAIMIHSDIYDVDNAHTIVHGFVSPANDTINLCIDADRTRLAFLNSMLDGIISDVTATATGQIYVIGSLSNPNLEGSAKAYGAMHVTTTGCTYMLHGDTIKLTRDKIAFDHTFITDSYGHTGYIDGSVDHKSLSHFTCNLDIHAENLLAYHSNGFNQNPFYGTTFVTGDANITANSKGLFIHADIRSDKNSSFIYDATSIGTTTSSNFIKFTDRNKKNITLEQEEEDAPRRSLLSRLNLEFMIDVTPDILLKVFTNVRTGDYIDLYGSGPITAVYDEKEGFSMKGMLNLERGTYKFTMQDIFPKEFDIIKGSTLEFNGDPFLADLNLNTKYLVPSASLSDLDPDGRRHKSVKVNCLMDITGKLDAPQLAFDIELPDASEEEREILASAINTPEQKNMQFVYLMGIGKFYTYDYNRSDGGSQSSSAMEALISNTISGQLNNMLSQIIDNRNWNISGNFSSGERGWNNMEVEGILEGRLLDNRLLINGNFGYRENPLANSNFVGDFEVQWLLDKNGNVSLKAYNKTNDRYFSESTLTTQGAGVILRHDFNDWRWWLKNNKKKKEVKETEK